MKDLLQEEINRILDDTPEESPAEVTAETAGTRTLQMREIVKAIEEQVDFDVEEDAGEHHHSEGGHHHHHHHHHHHERHDGENGGHHDSDGTGDKREHGDREHRHHHHSEHHEHSEKPQSKNRKKKGGKVGKIVAAIILILVLTIGGVAGYLFYQYQAVKNNTASAPVYDDVALGINTRVAEELKDYRNIAIYGLDNTKRSDVILVASFNTKTGAGKLFTVYRDTYMQLSPDKVYNIAGVDRDFFKCNHSYKKAGKIYSMNMLNRHLDLNVRECVGLDWEAVAALVDQLDGITVDITEYLAGFINQRLDDPIIVENGKARLNGKQAVAYLRTRKDPGSTAVTRSMRNQKVILDLFKLAKTMKKEDILDIFTKMLGKFETNMNIPTMLSLIKDVKGYTLESAGGWPYDYEILWDDAYYYYVPTTLQSNVAGLHFRLFDQADYEVTDTCQTLSDTIASKKKQLY